MRIDTQFSVFLVNKPGVLAQVTSALAKAKVNIVALSMMESSEHGVLRVVCDNADKAREVLKRHHDHWTETEVLSLALRNEPGVLAGVAEELAEAHINISYAYTSGGAPGGRTTCILKVADEKRAMKLLEKFVADNAGTKTQKREGNVRRAPTMRR